MDDRERDSITHGLRDTKLDTSQGKTPRSDPMSQSNVVSFTPKPRHKTDGAVTNTGGRVATFDGNSDHDLSPFEAAVKKSQGAFVAKLVEYHAALHCAANTDTNSDELATSIDDAMFAAHRIAGVGKTLGFTKLGEAARSTEVAMTAYKRDVGSAELRRTFHSRICRLLSMIEAICAEHDDRFA